MFLSPSFLVMAYPFILTYDWSLYFLFSQCIDPDHYFNSDWQLKIFLHFCAMFQRLQQKWKVSGTQLFLILCVFAITGTTTAYITRQITAWLQVEPYSTAYWLLKIAVLLFGYQILILLIAIPFGQFSFFWKYEKKILTRLGLMRKKTADTDTSATDNTEQRGNI